MESREDDNNWINDCTFEMLFDVLLTDFNPFPFSCHLLFYVLYGYWMFCANHSLLFDFERRISDKIYRIDSINSKLDLTHFVSRELNRFDWETWTNIINILKWILNRNKFQIINSMNKRNSKLNEKKHATEKIIRNW